MGLTLNMAFIKPLFVVEAYINSSCRIVKVKDDNGLDTLDAYHCKNRIKNHKNVIECTSIATAGRGSAQLGGFD